MRSFAHAFVTAICAVSAIGHAQAQTSPRAPVPPPDTLGLNDGNLTFQTPDFELKLVRDSQTVAALRPKSAGEFDFTPADLLVKRSSNGFVHFGDITFRARTVGSDSWADYSTARDRHPVKPLAVSGITFAAADLSPTLPTTTPLGVVRSWKLDRGRLVLQFTLTNRTDASVEIGALGIPLALNNIISDRSLEQAHSICAFSDPYIGLDAGYVQVTRLSGKGPALLITPEGKTPLEAYRLVNEPMRPNQTFEGEFAWQVLSKAYAEQEWKSAKQWNDSNSRTLKPGESWTIGLKFLLSPGIREIESTLIANGRPVAVGIPGYILPTDQEGKLFLNYRKTVKSVVSDNEGAIIATVGKSTQSGWQTLSVKGAKWGRTRLTVTYADGLTQTIHYYVTKPAETAVADLGHFLTTKQWFTDEADPFHRAPSVISYDRESDKQVLQDSRVWIAGLGDEGGSGSWLAAAMKELGQPNEEEVAKYEQFIDRVLWGQLQFSDGPNKYGVKKSVFFYDPAQVPGYEYDPKLYWKSWTSWSKQTIQDVGRGYNYPHVVAAYWSMYRIARNHPGLVKAHGWDWYLDQAYQTTKFLTETDSNGDWKVGYVDAGLMEGDIFLEVLKDLKREGWAEKATDIEARMRKRADHWKSLAFPFGSEMAWDSTGQEEVYAWCKYFGYDDKAIVSLDSILGYMPTVPHWGYNGNARRYWDFLYGGKLSRIERQLHHYGSGINSLPVLSYYREHPTDTYLLRVGYGGAMGALSNIDQEGFASAAFHSFPSTLQWDAYSGDYGPNFFGHALNASTYLVDDPNFGWQAFGGNVSEAKGWITVEPKDSFRSRVYVAPLGLWLTLDAGRFHSVSVNMKTHTVKLVLDPSDRFTQNARLRIEQPAKITQPMHLEGSFLFERDAFTIPLLGTGIELNVR